MARPGHFVLPLPGRLLAADSAWQGGTERVRRFIEDGADDHPAAGDLDDDKAPANWSIAVTDDCEACSEPRVILTVEPRGEHGRGVVAHLAPDSARRLRRVLAAALGEIGQAAD